jgi:beta-xylosidase
MKRKILMGTETIQSGFSVFVRSTVVALANAFAIVNVIAMVGAFVPAPAQPVAIMTSSPIVPGNQADPHIAVFGDRYYLYTTGFNCFSSPDLVTWTKHANPLELKTLKWGQDTAWIRSIEPRTWGFTAPWAPAAVARNGKYYFYFSADHYLGVAVADKPEGPFKDAVGKTLFDKWDGIDPMAFVDDDGEAYLFFGYAGTFGGVMAGVLNPDMVSWKTPPKLIANNSNGLKNYLEGPFMFKRKGVYYLTWSNDNWQTPEYNVQYATAEHPLGPYVWRGRILEKDAVSVGPGHHSILNIPGRDQWYIVYHRYDHTLTTAGKPRTAHIDTLRFNGDGTIVKVVMTDAGVRGVNLASVGIERDTRRARTAGAQAGWPESLELTSQGRSLTLRSGETSGSLDLLDAWGAHRGRYAFQGGETIGIGVPSPGIYWAVIRTGGREYHRVMPLTGP